MKLKEFLEISILFDYYGNLLSDKQKLYMKEHFERDHSLSEIAKSHDITRQAVYDNIKRGTKILKNYEEKIGFLKREEKIKKSLEELRKNYSKKKLDSLIANFDI